MPQEATSTTTEDLKQKIAQHIDTAREKLEALKKEIVALHEEDKETLEQKQEEIRKRVDEQKAKAQQMQADIQRWKEEKVAHTEEAIGTWQQKREIKKLQRRADRAEDYALELVTVAVMDFEEAGEAVFEAMAARFDADATAPSSP
jgi:TolA-binding protein